MIDVPDVVSVFEPTVDVDTEAVVESVVTSADTTVETCIFEPAVESCPVVASEVVPAADCVVVVCTVLVSTENLI